MHNSFKNLSYPAALLIPILSWIRTADKSVDNNTGSLELVNFMCLLIKPSGYLYWNGQLVWTPAVGLYTGMDN